MSTRDNDRVSEPMKPLLARISALPAPAAPSTTHVICIDGPSGAGKTTYAAELSAVLGGAPIVHMDDIYPGWDGLQEAVPRVLEWVLQPLARGQTARYQRYDWILGRYAEWHNVRPAEVLIVEGCGSGSLASAPYLSLLVWVEAPAELRFDRGMQRDGEAYRPHWTGWQRQEEALFARERTRVRADLIIDGS